MHSPLFKWPGKVLLAGGYGVLQKGNVGLVLAIANYFYGRYERLEEGHVEESCTRISVESPQICSSWCFEYHWDSSELKEIEASSPNEFVRCALLQALRYFGKEATMRGLCYRILLLFDSGFVSHEQQNHPKGDKFLDFGHEKLKKTGLGSSACVTVGIVSLVCLIHSRLDPQLVDWLSQIANLSAQGKIGSNFDISSAVHGTHLYTNVLPELARAFINSNGSDQRIFEAKGNVVPLRIGSKLHLQMLDLQCGSNTREMVGSFRQRFAELSEVLQSEFFSESRQIVLELKDALCSSDIGAMRFINQKHRRLQRRYSQLTKVDIEPACLTPFLNALAELPQTAYVVCPGSGGFDAICWITTAAVSSSRLPASDNKIQLRQLPISNDGMQLATQIEQQKFDAYFKRMH